MEAVDFGTISLEDDEKTFADSGDSQQSKATTQQRKPKSPYFLIEEFKSENAFKEDLAKLKVISESIDGVKVWQRGDTRKDALTGDENKDNDKGIKQFYNYVQFYIYVIHE